MAPTPSLSFSEERVYLPIIQGIFSLFPLQGITDTAQTIYETAAREHESRGVTGAVGEVLRQIPPAVVKPLIVATEATSNVLGGMRNQIRPDVRQDESQKWRHGED